MAMVVQHNLTAMNANRMLGITTGQQAKSSEKLSSGYRINRAADDAAGLTISEKMRKQIRGLEQASTNAQDGISCVQTAEGALTEVHSMLQRMNELAVQAANGTMSEDDRQAVQDEIDQLVTEIDRVSETTKFNEIYLLKGDGEEVKSSSTTPASIEIGYVDTITGENQLTWANNATALYATVDGVSTQVSSTNYTDFFEIDENGTAVKKDGVAFYATAPNETNEYGAQLTEANITVTDYVKVESDLLYDKVAGTLVKEEELKAGGTYFDADGKYLGGLAKYNTATPPALTEVGAEQIDNYVAVTRKDEETINVMGAKALSLNLHVGAESADDNKIKVEIQSMSASGIGVDVLKETGVMTEDAATAAIDTIAEAIAKVSEQRSSLGAIQNRLEHTIANLDNVAENTTAAESRIRDTDMAEEMVEYSKNNILAQAGQSMLAQANTSTQGVLSLLQ